MSFIIKIVFPILNFLFLFLLIESNAQEIKNTTALFDPKSLLPKECGIDNHKSKKRVVGGEVTKKYEFPWMARIYFKTPRNKYLMMNGASLITDRYVLTAAHVVAYDKPGYKPVLVLLCDWDRYSDDNCTIENSNNMTLKAGMVVVPIEEIIIHHDYDEFFNENDIALVRLAQKVEFSDLIHPICLPTDASLADEFTTAGWGLLGPGPNAKSARYLMKINLPRVNYDLCKTFYPDMSPDSQICAGIEKMKDTCQGDSGGPLMQKNEEDRWVLVGITSFGKKCGSGLPAVYTNVFYFRDWILQNLRE